MAKKPVRVLVLGGYGFIGLAIVRRLLAARHDVVCVGRRAGLGERLEPRAKWLVADIARLSGESWRPFLEGVDIVVNAAGALQDGARDRVDAVHDEAIRALISSCTTQGFVQISAPGATPEATTRFLRSKARADAALRASALAWVIFRPGIVIGHNAFGGSALLRLLAGLPWILPLVLAGRPIQTVAAADVAEAVHLAVEGQAPVRREYDLVEEKARPLKEVVLAFRHWLGLPAPRAVVAWPDGFGFAIARLADLAGWLGWRPALRTTALRVLDRGVTGDPAPWQSITGRPLRTLEETLAEIPATRQERVFAKAELALPLIIITLSVFWLASGVIALAEWEATRKIIEARMPPALARAGAVAGSLADIVIGLAVAFRPTARAGCLAAALLTCAYLMAASIADPKLWLDPLGPLVKAIPALVLALSGAALLEER